MVKENKADAKQTGLFGEKPFVSRNKKIIKSGSLRFYPPSGETTEAVIDDIINKHGRTNFLCLSSGGKDSMSMTHYIAENYPDNFGGVVHIKTNIGLKMTSDFLVDECKRLGYKLYVIEPNPKFTYASHVLQYGFPGPGFHRLIMGKLKYKTMRDFALTMDRKNHCLMSGVRKFESVRRMGNYPYPIQSDGAMWFACPFFYKTTEETYEYVHTHGLKISPAYRTGLGTSGECLCGSFAQGGEKAMIRKLDPNLADYIEWLEDGVKRFGTWHAKRYPKWGNSPYMTDLDDQKQIDEFFKDNPEMKNVNEIESTMCGAECGAGTMRGMIDY
jgi:3'-phosphoadenosine 5'-phosphosulfate sulfotransferase (PAPS reductase)/FAD synthetase